MPRRTAVRLVAATAAVAAASTVLAAGPAHADTQQHRDPRGDVAVVKTSARADYRTHDIVRYRNTFENGLLRMETTLRDRASRGWLVSWIIGDGAGLEQLGSGSVAPARRGDGLRVDFQDANGFACDVLADVVGNTVVLDVPVNCLGGATEVRIANFTFAGAGRGRTLLDDANRGKLKRLSPARLGPTLTQSLG